MYNAALELYNGLLGTYFDRYHGLLDTVKGEMGTNHDPANLTLEKNQIIKKN